MASLINQDTGEIFVATPEGWQPAKRLQNPQTGEQIYLDGEEWKPVPFKAGLGQRDRDVLNAEGWVGRATRSLSQGATLGFGDEVAAAGAATGRFLKTLTGGGGVSDAYNSAGQRYDEVLARERGALKDFAKDNPGTNAALQVVGGFGSGPAVMRGAAAAVPAAVPTMAQVAKQSAVGAGSMGAVAGFGSGEGGLAERLMNAGTTGALSAGIGAATPYVVKGVGAGVEVAKNLLGSTNADEQAQQLILRAMQRDGLSVQDAIQKYNAGQLTGAKPEALIDIGGENVRGLMRSASNLPGPAKEAAQEFVTTRQAGQGGRIADDLADNLSPSTNYGGTVDALKAQRSAAAKPLYDEAYGANPAMDSPLLQRIERTPAGKRAFAEAREMMADDMQRLGVADRELTDLAREAGTEGGEAIPRAGVAPGLKLEFWDYVKRALDDQIDGAKLRGRNNRARILTGMKNELTGELDRLDVTARTGPNSVRPDGGAYARARASYAGPSRSIEALELGRGVLKADTDLTAKQIAELAPGDKEFFRAGVVKAIKDVAEATRDGADITKRIFGTPTIRERIAAAFESPQAFQKFESQIKREAAMYTNAQQISPRANSRTATLGEEIEDVRRNPVVQFAIDAVKQNPYRATMNAAGNLYDRGRGINEGTSRSLARMLLETNPNALNQNLGNLSGKQAEDLARALEIARRVGLAGSLQGRTVGVLSN